MEKIIDIEERIPSMRKKRRRKTNRKFSFILVVFVLLLLAILYFQSSLSRIHQIKVNGFSFYDEQFYEEASGLETDGSLWGFSRKDVVTKMKAIEGVKDVSVQRKWLRDVEIDITEWDKVAYVEDRGQYSLLLENGELFTSENQLLEDEAPILNGFEKEEDRKRISAQLMKLDDDVYPLISEIILTGTKIDPDTITVYMNDGFEIRAIMSNFADQMTYYPDITAQLHDYEKGVIDMEVGTFFTPFSELYNPSGKVEEENES